MKLTRREIHTIIVGLELAANYFIGVQYMTADGIERAKKESKKSEDIIAKLREYLNEREQSAGGPIE